MVATLVVTESELDGLLAIAKQQLPALANVEQIRLDGGSTGVRVKLKAPVIGTVEAQVRLVLEAG